MPHVLFICLKVFFGRICDVSLGTVRTMLTVRGKTWQAALVGFVEVFLWYIVVKDALASDTPMLITALFYAGGFASGTYIGGILAKKLVRGQVTVQVITSSRNNSIPDQLRASGYGISVLDVNSSQYGDEKYLILANVEAGQVRRFENEVRKLDDRAFIIVQDTRSHIGGYNRAFK